MRSGGQSGHFSSVDNADTAIGQIVVAQALYEQMALGKSGSYGALTSANAAGPSPAPTPSPSTTATATVKQAANPGHARQAVRAAGRHGLGERAVSRRRGPRGAAGGLIGAVLAAGAARGAYALLSRGPPGGAATWTRTNHRGEPVTLLEGPAAATGAALAAALAPGLPARTGPRWWRPPPGRRRSAAMTTWRAAATGAASAVTWGPWPSGEVTTGAVKIGGIGATGLAASALLGGGPVDVAVNAGLIAGGANLLNLFDLRPGRAIKVAALAGGALIAADRAARRRAARGHAGGHPARRRARAAARGPGRTGHARRRGGQRPRGHARRRGRGEPARPAGRRCWPGSSPDRGQREGQLHQGHPADTRRCTGSTCSAAVRRRPPRRVTGRHPGPGSHGPDGTVPRARVLTAPARLRISPLRRGRQPAPRDRGAGSGGRGRPGAGHRQGAGRRRDRPGRRPHRRDHHRVEPRGLRPPAGLRAHRVRDAAWAPRTRPPTRCRTSSTTSSWAAP